MHILKSVRTPLTIICILCFGMVLTPSSFAFLAQNDHVPKNIDVWASVYLDRLDYDPAGEGVVYVEGSFGVYNMNAHRECIYTFEVRLEIFKKNKKTGKWGTLTPDAKTAPLIFGTLGVAAEPWENFDASGSDNHNLLFCCLSDGPHKASQEFRAEATVTLNVTQKGWTETWMILKHPLRFEHEPQGETGLGPTMDGETFFDNCDAIGGIPWQSLIITEIPYDVIYWYIKAPGDTSYYGTPLEMQTDWGDGAEKRATMTHTFPEDVGGQFEEGTYYQIGALVHRSDNIIKWETYKVWVQDRN